MLVLALLTAASASSPPGSSPDELARARAAAEASIREGEAHLLRSRYWQTYTTERFRAVVPSYADPTVRDTPDGRRWQLDLAGPYELEVLSPARDIDGAVRARLQALGGQAKASTVAGERRHDVRGARQDATLLVRELGGGPALIEVRAPRGELDGTVLQRVLDGVRPLS